MLKVGIMTTWRQMCGICTYSSFLGEALRQEGLEVTILAERKDVLPQGFDPDFQSDLPYIECWNRNEPFDELVEIIRREKFNIVHIQHQFALFPYDVNLQALLSDLKTLACKVIITLHDVIAYDPQVEDYFRVLMDFPDALIVHTDLCENLLLTSWKCPKEKVFKILHGTKLIDVPPKLESREKLGLPLDSTIILSWGFLWGSKGIIDLVEVFEQVLKKYPKAIFIHAGGLHPVFSAGEYLRDVLKKAYRLGIRPENFKITGFLNEEQIKLYFGCCDLIVLNYMRGSASASGAAHRALAAGKPICGTDDPCIAEIPKYTVPRFDKVSLLRGILETLENKKIQNGLVAKGKIVAEETSWANTAKKHLEIFMGGTK